MATETAPSTEAARDVGTIVYELVQRASAAQRQFEAEFTTQERVNEAVQAVAWAAYSHAEELARMAREESGMGRYEDKVLKNRRKTFGTLRDLLQPEAISVGVISDESATGVMRIAKPVGVVAAITPSTNPSAAPLNKAMMAVKGRNAVILAPSPKAARTCARVVELVHEQFRKVGAPLGVVQVLPRPITKALTHELMRQAGLVIATGSQANVRAAYSSGTPAIGVGVGNVPVVIDDSADLDAAAEKVRRSKTFDYATSCSSENSVVVSDAVYDEAVAALERHGGQMLDAADKRRLQDALWVDGHLNGELLAQPPGLIAEKAGLRHPIAGQAEFFMVEDDGFGPDHPFSGEKLSVVLTVYRFRGFDDCVRVCRGILNYQGNGHSVGIHTADMAHAERLANELTVVRVLVNQSHTFGNGGGWDNRLNFTLSMGCGAWGGNSISENLSYRHFLNITHLVRPIPELVPSEGKLFGSYWEKYGK